MQFILLLSLLITFTAQAKQRNGLAGIHFPSNMIVALSEGKGSHRFSRRSYPSSTSDFTTDSTSSPFFQNDMTHSKEAISDFYNRDSRLGFIRKVYSIFGAQTLTTVIMLFTAMKNRNFRRYLLQSRDTLTVLSSVVSLIISFVLSSSKTLRHRFPYNILLVSLFTIAYSTSLTIFSLQFHPQIILMSLFYTCLTFALITSYSFNNNPKLDLTSLGSLLFTGLTALLVGQVANIFYFRAPFLENLFAIVGAMLFAGFIVYDTQMIVSGRKKMQSFSSYFFPQNKNSKKKMYRKEFRRDCEYEYYHQSGQMEEDGLDEKSPVYYNSKEYILASMNLYVDFIGLLIQLIKALAVLDKNNRKNSTSDDD